MKKLIFILCIITYIIKGVKLQQKEPQPPAISFPKETTTMIPSNRHSMSCSPDKKSPETIKCECQIDRNINPKVSLIIIFFENHQPNPGQRFM